jgi:26S proteasome regulatory subunit N2
MPCSLAHSSIAHTLSLDRYALSAGDLFDVNASSEYVHAIIAKCIDTYAQMQRDAYATGTSAASIPGLVEVVERMFDRCFQAGEFKQAAGIAMETRRLDVLERSILTSDDPASMMEYTFDVVTTMIANRAFRGSVLTILARLYSEMPQPDYFKMCKCFIYLQVCSAHAPFHLVETTPCVSCA